MHTDINILRNLFFNVSLYNILYSLINDFIKIKSIPQQPIPLIIIYCEKLRKL